MEDKKPKITVTSFSPVAIWSYDTSDTVCQICKNKLTEICIKCSNKSLREDKDYKTLISQCSVAKGKCQHAFHQHCISSWVADNNGCPIEQTPWVYESMDLNNPKKTFTK